MRQRFKAFGYWLGKEVGVHKAAITLNKFVPFFAELDKTWQRVPDYQSLLMHFSAEGLRRVRLPMRWLSSTGDVTVDARTRENDSEQRRIEATLSKIPSSSSLRVYLDGYYEILLQRHENKRLSIRSLRFSLTPAVALLVATDDEGTAMPNQNQLDALLTESPGQRASISGFIVYLREHHNAQLSLPTLDPLQARKNRRKKVENEIAKLAQTPLSDEESLRLWIELALNYFHDIPRKTGRALAGSEHVIVKKDGFWVCHNDKQHYIPTRPLGPYTLT